MARILLIDDEANIRMMIRLALQHTGYTVETASDGLEGLEKFGDGGSWDLVLLDQRMPEMEGLEVLREVRNRDPAARVIMITAFGTIDLAVEALKAGARDFLRKPFTADTLRGAVSTVLDGAAPEEPSGTRRGTPGKEMPPSPLTFCMSTLNGFWIESRPAMESKEGKDTTHTFTVHSPAGEMRECQVLLPAFMVELIKAYSDQEQMPGGDRFWHALCEEVLANYLWQNSVFPPEEVLRVEDLTSGLKRWIGAVLMGQ